MVFLGEMISIAGLLLLVPSFTPAIAQRALARLWGFTVLLTGMLVIAIWAIRTDHDNLEYGLRPGRLLMPGLLTGVAFVWAAFCTVAWYRGRVRDARTPPAVNSSDDR